MKLLVDTNTLIDLVAGGGNAETLGRADKVLLPKAFPGLQLP